MKARVELKPVFQRPDHAPKNPEMEALQSIVYAFAAKPWHLIVFAMIGFVTFFLMRTRSDIPKR